MKVAVVGAGIGGLTTAAMLRRIGVEVEIYEQAARFARIGAGIQMTPNAMRVLRSLGLEERLLQVAYRPAVMRNRDWDTGRLTFELALDRSVETYGAPYLLLHRGDLHEALRTLVPDDVVRLGKKLVDLDQAAGSVHLRFVDGTTATADAVIGADGVHSRVREIILGPEEPVFTGRVAYRTVYPAALLDGHPIDPGCKWWGPDRHIVIYFVSRGREVYFTTSVPEDWRVESWSAEGDVEQLRAAFAGFHASVRRVLEVCPAVHRWAIYERSPLPAWCQGAVVLLGDACHPMTPYMAQGAATSMEDAAVLARCLEGVSSEGVAVAFRRYEASRKPRTSQIQLESRKNRWLRHPVRPEWVYGYDACEAPLAPQPRSTSAS
jgi:6-hydroxynicotinate 3-monooxygenase